MNLLESKLNSTAAIADDASLNSARIDYVNQNFYNKANAVTALNSKQKTIVEAPATLILGQSADYINIYIFRRFYFYKLPPFLIKRYCME